MKLDAFTNRGTFVNGDRLVGHRGTTPGSESSWTKEVILASINSLTKVTFPANSAASGALGQIAYSNGVLAIFVGEPSGPNWVFLNVFERD
jgi:hypothetical protein